MIKSVEKVKNIIFISSGKGGVGKSMVASNLAVALARNGYQAALLDADLYGPSLPLAMGVVNEQPGVKKEEGVDIIQPINSFGVKIMSLGFLVNKKEAVIWRGPMASNALTQLLENTNWGELDYLIVDTPPGTGDICITLAQKLPQAKAMIVITPQEMAVADGRKAANMYKSKGIDIDLIGVVENMSYFTPEKHPDEKYFLFGQGGGAKLAQEMDVPLLAEIPLIGDVCELGDKGKPVFVSTNATIIKTFEELSEKVGDILMK